MREVEAKFRTHPRSEKEKLRRELIQNRLPCPDKARLIFNNILSLEEFRESDLILSYISTEKEIDTRKLIQTCFELKKKVAVPKTLLKTDGVHIIKFYEINSFDDVEEGRFGILEPLSWCGSDTVTTRPEVRIEDAAKPLCILPALACNKRGYRLGYGKGCYDRFLADYEQGASKFSTSGSRLSTSDSRLSTSGSRLSTVVLCYSENIIELPVEAHDLAAELIITEGGVFYG